MTVTKAFKYRIYPNKQQKTLIAKTFGCTRFVFNHFLFKENTGFPRYKTKNTNAFSFTTKCVNNNIQFLGKSIKLPKMGHLKTNLDEGLRILA